MMSGAGGAGEKPAGSLCPATRKQRERRPVDFALTSRTLADGAESTCGVEPNYAILSAPRMLPIDDCLPQVFPG